MNQSTHVRQLVLCSLFAALVAVGAFIKISIPIDPFPMHFTLQLFFALLSGFLLGPRLSILSVGVYLILGLIGVPIFAAGGGLSYLIRPTFGFLLGFAFAAGITGILTRWFSKKYARQSFWLFLLAATVGMIAYYICGMVYFYLISNYVINMPVTWPVVFVNCFLITLLPDFILCILSALLALQLLPQLKRSIPL
ncbi:MAG: biotin transporter BioY [Firmicutes bacterium]|nr:biotin transporter BioY [Bacillota bacterium]